MKEHYQSEMRKGYMVLAVLSQLSEPQYGYSLSRSLEEHEFPIETNTLYPLLRRLEKAGLLESTWDTQESNPRKYYQKTTLGDDIYKALVEYHTSNKEVIDQLI